MTEGLDEWMTVPEVASLKGVAESSVRLAVLTKRIAGKKMGRNYLVKRSDVTKWKPVRGRGRKKKERNDVDQANEG